MNLSEPRVPSWSYPFLPHTFAKTKTSLQKQVIQNPLMWFYKLDEIKKNRKCKRTPYWWGSTLASTWQEASSVFLKSPLLDYVDMIYENTFKLNLSRLPRVYSKCLDLH